MRSMLWYGVGGMVGGKHGSLLQARECLFLFLGAALIGDGKLDRIEPTVAWFSFASIPVSREGEPLACEYTLHHTPQPFTMRSCLGSCSKLPNLLLQVGRCIPLVVALLYPISWNPQESIFCQTSKTNPVRSPPHALMSPPYLHIWERQSYYNILI